MTARNQPHKYRCETCKNTDCEVFNKEPLAETIAAYRVFASWKGCASHSDASNAEQRIKDVIAKLEKDLKVGVGAYHKSGRHEQEYWKDRIEEALALLRGKGK